MNKPKELAEHIIQFLQEKDWYGELPVVVELLEREVFRNQEITLISATSLSQEDKEKVEKMLAQKWGEHPVRYMVDPILLSGMIIKFQHQVMDLSGRGALQELKQELIT